jgi:3-hydroxyisobutyrate dehydrogenase-like beta-hydroxyacid dehydrogenase
MIVGIVGAGEMGSVLGARLRDGGARVVVALEGRTERTRALAADAGLDDVGSLARLLSQADVVLSVVPPGEARAVAAAVAALGATPGFLFADLNAVSPTAMDEIAASLAVAGVETVDGSISGPPPRLARTTTIYLSGERAAELAALPFDGVERRVVGDVVGLASVVKMCTASVYKGRVAILAQALRTAHAHGVVEPVLADLAATGVADPERVGATLARASAKAWRYVPEMEEIACTQAAAGLTPDLFDALAKIYAGLAAVAVADAPERVPESTTLATVLEQWGRAR